MTKTNELISFIKNKNNNIRDWFTAEWKTATPVPYFSCDVRNASFKMGIVDTNLFPAGFNNLCTTYTHKLEEEFKHYFETQFPNAKNIVLYLENHTRNKFYLLNAHRIQQTLENIGLNCMSTMPVAFGEEQKINITFDAEQTLTVYEHKIVDDTIVLSNNFRADVILSNNDFSSGVPQELEACQRRIVPNINLGWHKRKKSYHFEQLAADRFDGNKISRTHNAEFDTGHSETNSQNNRHDDFSNELEFKAFKKNK